MRRARFLTATLALLCLAAAASATEVTFRFASDAERVFLAGDFNGWSDSALPLEEGAEGVFEVTVDLEPGSHQYKYVVDGTWMEDPSSPDYADDGFGGRNSVVEVGGEAMVVGAGAAPSPKQAAAPPVPAGTRPVRFAVEAPGAAAVHLAGEFNQWNPTARRMEDPDGDGIFETLLPLAPGRYAYKFVIDGTWKEDPTAAEFVDDGFGGKNSVVEVADGEQMLVTGPGAPGAVSLAAGETAGTQAEAPAGERLVRFTVEAPGASGVYLAGEFNGWNASGQAMNDADGDGVFEAVIPLKPGRYAYKFVVDGNWQADPEAVDSVDDGFGGKNSVVTVVGGEGVQEAGAGAGTSTGQAAPADGAAHGQFSVTFSYQPPIGGVSQIFLAGTFNDWNAGATPMTDPDGDGIYEATLLLAAGQYQYKFVVDGEWVTDENAASFADDGFGGRNSVLDVDNRYEKMELEVGDGEIYLKGLDVVLSYATVNAVDEQHLIFQTRAYRDDVEKVSLRYREGDGGAVEVPMAVSAKDPVFVNYRYILVREDPGAPVRFTFHYRDASAHRWATGTGFVDEEPAEAAWILYTEELLPPFSIPLWAQQGIYYQIFADRFANGDASNDQDFTEPYYQGRNELPPGGKTNGEYFHLIEDWDDVSGLVKSPYRTDGKPDYYSFYGGDIAGIHEKIPYLAELGVSIIYFNPITDARSNHRYDPCDYLSLDPHLATEEEFQAFSAACADAGIRIIVDMAFNHTGDCHFAFQDVLEKWKDSEYYDWYEWKQRPPSYPLPPGANASDYYDCWWGFGLHPNLNFDLSRPQDQENGVMDPAEAEVNQAVVDYLLEVPAYWLGELGCSGFRLDVPNEVPFWFWGMFRDACRAVKEDHILIGEIWGDAGQWIDPAVFDAVMNYRSFKDPVVKWIGQKQGNAAVFDQELAGGRTRYPLQAVRAQMNLIDSHDTQRFLRVAGEDARRLRLAATFAMCYVGAPHIYYGDELGLTGGKDPDCRRTMPWSSMDAPARRRTLEHYRTVSALRRAHPALSLGSFSTVLAQGQVFAFVREYEGETVLVVLNNAETAIETVVPVGNAGIPDGASFTARYGEGGGAVARGALEVTVPAVDAVILTLD